MIFEVNRYYAHEAGRQIAVLAEVKSFKWGKMLVIEEADKTGHSISCAEVGQEANDNNWVEIGHGEWMANFSPANPANDAFRADLDKFHAARLKERIQYKVEKNDIDFGILYWTNQKGDSTQ